MALAVCTRGGVEAVVFVAGGLIDFSRAVIGQRAGPEVVAGGAELDGRQLELLVGGDATHPQRTGVDGVHVAVFGHLVGSVALGTVLPEGASGFDECTNVVPFEVLEGGSRSAGGSHRAGLSGAEGAVGLSGRIGACSAGTVGSDVLVGEGIT